MGPTVIYTVDIGDANLRGGVYIDGETNIVTTVDTPKETQFPGGPKLLATIRQVIETIAAHTPPMQALAVSASGIMTLRPNPGARAYGPFKDSELFVVAPNVDGLKYAPLVKLIEAMNYGVPVHVENDVNAALESNDTDLDVVGIALGAGLGAAAKKDGEVIHVGQTWSCFEIGHGMRWSIPEELSFRCHCASMGCLEAAIGGWAMTQRYGVEPENAPPEMYDQMRQDVVNLLPQAIAGVVRQTAVYNVALCGLGAEGYARNSSFLDNIRERVNEQLETNQVTVKLLALGDTAELHGSARALLRHGVI